MFYNSDHEPTCLLFPVLGVGHERDTAMNSIAPLWDGNETWLVLVSRQMQTVGSRWPAPRIAAPCAARRWQRDLPTLCA